MSDDVDIEQLRAAIRDVPDFPKLGIIYKDITPILGQAKLFQSVIDRLAAQAETTSPHKIVGIDARGFLFGAAVAYKLGVGFVPVRKKGKLPYRTISYSYTLEYGQADMEMHVDAIVPGEKVVLVDDLLATGGTSRAAVRLVRDLGGELDQALYFIELGFLHGRDQLSDIPIHSLVTF
jgi:adenine phosphoribosyltransferase